MVKDAETFAEEDKKLKEKVEARNELESFVYSLKNQVSYSSYLIIYCFAACGWI